MRNKRVHRLTVLLCALMIYALPAVSMDIDGFYSIGYENIQNKGRNASRLKQYLGIDAAGIGLPELSFYGYGRLMTAIHDDESDGDLFLGYFEYSTFQSETSILLGRFDLTTNRFMTLDGLQVTQITPWYFGVTGYAGSPRYREAEEKGDEFRYTGDLAYGAQIFLNGIESFQFNINYYRENGMDDNRKYVTYKETLGTAGSWYRDFGAEGLPLSLGFSAFLDQDIQNGVLERLGGKGSLQYRRVKAVLQGDYFDVRDNYPAGRELIIRLISAGLESRGGGSLYFDITDNFNLYGGATFTRVNMRGGGENAGQIYRLGANALFVKEAGVSLGFEFYDYESEVADATGILFALEWAFTEDISLYTAYEQAWMRRDKGDDNAYSIEGRLSAYLTESLILAVYGQKGSRNRFVDDYKWGAQVNYEF